MGKKWRRLSAMNWYGFIVHDDSVHSFQSVQERKHFTMCRKKTVRETFLWEQKPFFGSTRLCWREPFKGRFEALMTVFSFVNLPLINVYFAREMGKSSNYVRKASHIWGNRRDSSSFWSSLRIPPTRFLPK